MWARDEQRVAVSLPDQTAHHLERGRGESHFGLDTRRAQHTREELPARRHVEENERLVAQGLELDRLRARQAVPLRQQHVGLHLGEDGEVEIRREVLVVEQRQVEAPRRETAHEILLVTLAQPDLDARVPRGEVADQLGHVARRERDETADLEPAHHLAARGSRLVLEGLEVAQQRARLGQQAPPRCGERHAARVVPDEQPHPELLLELPERVRDRGLGDVEPARGLHDAAALGHGDEVLELADAVAGHTELHD